MEPCGSPIIHVTFPRYIIEWLVVYKKRGRGADRAKSGPFHLVSRAVRQTTLRLITKPISSLVVTCFAAKALQQSWKMIFANQTGVNSLIKRKTSCLIQLKVVLNLREPLFSRSLVMQVHHTKQAFNRFVSMFQVIASFPHCQPAISHVP